MTKKQLLKTIDGFGGRAFHPCKMFDEAMDEDQARSALRHLRELERAGKVQLIRRDDRSDPGIWCSKHEPDSFVTDSAQVRFGLRLDR